MKVKKLVFAGTALATGLASIGGLVAQTSTVGSGKIKHVLLIGIDGMHEYVNSGAAR